MTIHVHNGKGAKDRILPLPADLLPLLRAYYKQYKPVVYLFNGENKQVPLSIRMIQHVVVLARSAAGIQRKVSVHTLRHCYATHVYQDGISGLALQLLLGHKDFKTTSHYVHLSGDHYQGVPHPAQDLCKQLSNKYIAPSTP